MSERVKAQGTGAFADLDTPSLLVDLDVLERNIEEMASVARDAGVRLCPHTKTHKCPEIAHMQVAAGASGITVAKLGEAEVMADAGLDDLLLAYPIVGTAKLDRLRDLLDRAAVRVSLDSMEVADGIGRVGTARGRPVPVLVEVDVGLHRLGRPPGDASANLVAQIDRVQGIEVLGLLTHAGNAYHARDAADLREIAEREALDLLETAERCAAAGVEIREVSIGSTPTARIGATVPGVTEIRPGTYVFNDVTMVRLGVASEHDCALRVLATVVARPAPDRFVIDSGSKALTSDGSTDGPFPGRGIAKDRPELRLDFLSEEHGVGHLPEEATLSIGDRLQVIPLHACGCVNMFDIAYGIRGGEVERELQILGRGKVR
jgi:D-serine deaminase-like pyridoxal phosphate-dependent protein